MVLQDFKIIFDNPQASFFIGETVTGRLVVQLNQPKYMRSILVKFRGEANCAWSESRTVRNNGEEETHVTQYKDHDLYFENHVTLFGGTGNTEVLPPGSHFYQFSLPLPNHLPSSFEGKYGHIRYSVKGIIDRPWKFNHEVMANFTVLSKVDLNLDPVYRAPVQLEKSKYFCCCCCKSGPMNFIFHIPSKGYVPGQYIPVTVDIENGSNVKVLYVTCELLKTVTYFCASPRSTKQECTEIAHLVFDDPVPANDSKTFTGQMRIPPVPPSMLKACSIIDLDYRLIVKAVPKGMHGSLEHCVTVVIGTVPLWQSSCPQQPTAAPSAPPVELRVAPAPPTAYTDMPLPTYEECMQEPGMPMTGAMGYSPRYPTYKLPGGPSTAGN
ncbi:arrestin domain-containing protein 2-like [Periplaneta americana]|uniref:arrestin domain-containing protein 2-like n=1 Tax=Periplaneta americana TaxID=6978 RepID=UPI0037E89F56